MQQIIDAMKAEPQRFGGASRWTCRACGDAVLESRYGHTYGSAHERKCEPSTSRYGWGDRTKPWAGGWPSLVARGGNRKDQAMNDEEFQVEDIPRAPKSRITVEDAKRIVQELQVLQPRPPAARDPLIGTQTTWNDLVRVYLPDADDDTADWLLWERTCFPLGSTGQVAAQLRSITRDGRRSR